MSHLAARNYASLSSNNMELTHQDRFDIIITSDSNRIREARNKIKVTASKPPKLKHELEVGGRARGTGTGIGKGKGSEERERRLDSKHVILYTPTNTITSVIIFISLCTLLPEAVDATAPSIDYSHNMRILKLPKSTQPGSLIYRLRGSDADPNSQLVFGVSGLEARSLLDVQPVPGSWNEADVYLRSSLEDAPPGRQYNLSVYVTDGNTSTQVESSIFVTEEMTTVLSPMDDLHRNQLIAAGAVGSSFEAPFVAVKRVFQVPENSEPDESIGTISALERPTSELPVRFELRGRGADRFSIKYIFGPRGQSKAELLIAQQLDYERQNLFNLKVLALNAWTDSRWDTRNVATLDIVISVTDVQDTPPVFRNLPHSLKLATSLLPGQLISTFEAEDGDLGDLQRPIQFALDASSSLASYFDIGRESGQLRLIRPLAELLADPDWLLSAKHQTSIFPVLGILASEQPDASSYDHLWPPMYTKIELPLVVVELINESPKFIGGWQSMPSDLTTSNKPSHILHGYLFELPTSTDAHTVHPASLTVHWYTNGSDVSTRPMVIDSGLGHNGTFELILSGPDAPLFELEPRAGQHVIGQTSLGLTVAAGTESSLFDHESSNSKRVFSLEIIARDFGSPTRLSTRIGCSIELIDLNDNFPQFEQELYTFSIYESASIGQLVGQVRARDPDSSTPKTALRYGPLVGRDKHLFRLDEESGQISLEGALDREKRSQYLFSVVAQDQAGQRNYTQLQIDILDVNDNAPIFLQTHYETVLQSDGTFQQPLQVRAVDADEPGTANSQVAYEIIAGNQNEQFSIDALTGSIYPATSAIGVPQVSTSSAFTLPSILSEPIVPFTSSAPEQLAAGRILPGREIEETTSVPLNRSTSHYQQSLQRGRIASGVGELAAQVPSLDLLLNLESSSAQQLSTLPVKPQNSDLIAAAQLISNAHLNSYASLARQLSSVVPRIPPLSNLVVRAHDFGIPLRSSTVKVSIYNQALMSRSLSVILNGSAEQLEPRKDAIERALSSITGARVTVESIDALSESSSISVARLKLAVPHHSLVDLTDLSSLINALDFRPVTTGAHEVNANLSQHHSTTTGSAQLAGQQQAANNGHQSYSNEVHSYALEASGLERRLLIYIIMVAVCILSLLVIWMVYSCSREEREARILEKSLTQLSGANFRAGQEQQSNNFGMNSTEAKRAPLNPLTNQLLGKTGQPTRPLVPLSVADHASMYNGQLWFGPSPAQQQQRDSSGNRRASSAPSAGSLDHHSGGSTGMSRGSTTPRNGVGQFFPNPRGYTENLAALESRSEDRARLVGQPMNQLGRRQRRRKVAPAPPSRPVSISSPMEGGVNLYHEAVRRSLDGINVPQVHEPPKKPPRGSNRVSGENTFSSGGKETGSRTHSVCSAASEDVSSLSCSSTTSCPSVSSRVEQRDRKKLSLNEDQQLLGYDHSGTPIIATRKSHGDALVIDVSRLGADELPEVKVSDAPSEGKVSGAKQQANKDSVPLPSQPPAPPPPPPPPLPGVKASEVDVSPESGVKVKSWPISQEKLKDEQTKRGDLMSELHERLSQRQSSSGSEPQIVIEESEVPADASVSSGRGRVENSSSPVGENELAIGSGSSTLRDMRNAELLERASIFALTYGGLATTKLPAI